MQYAITLGLQAKGRTGDNPYVGCVIVREGQILAEGATQEPGKDHAEAAAIRQALSQGLNLQGATLYSTLEPCSFVGRTPACAQTIITHQLARVVIGMRDPHPRVNGQGIQLLRNAGLEVTEGVCHAEVRAYLYHWLTTFHAPAWEGAAL